MKNKIFIIFIFFILISGNYLNANEFTIESTEVKILEKGNITEAKKGVKIISNDGIEISSNELIYNKKKNILRVFGDVKIKDKKNNIITEGEEYIYYKNIEKIESKGKTNSKIHLIPIISENNTPSSICIQVSQAIEKFGKFWKSLEIVWKMLEMLPQEWTFRA